MNKFFKSLASTTLIVSSSAFAAPANYMFSAICDKTDAVATVLIASDESPVLFANHLEDKGHVIALWVSEEGSMTVTQTIGNTTCILAVGINTRMSKSLQEKTNPTTLKTLN